MPVDAQSQPLAENIAFLKSMGMIEIEPRPWVSGWPGSPGTGGWVDNLGPAGEEHLDMLMRAGRVKNEFDMEQSCSHAACRRQ